MSEILRRISWCLIVIVSSLMFTYSAQSMEEFDLFSENNRFQVYADANTYKKRTRARRAYKRRSVKRRFVKRRSMKRRSVKRRYVAKRKVSSRKRYKRYRRISRRKYANANKRARYKRRAYRGSRTYSRKKKRRYVKRYKTRRARKKVRYRKRRRATRLARSYSQKRRRRFVRKYKRPVRKKYVKRRLKRRRKVVSRKSYRRVVKRKRTYVRKKTALKKTAVKRVVAKKTIRRRVKSKFSGRSRFSNLIAKHASRYGVPVNLAHAVVRIESNYRPSVRGGAGEIGLMQIKPATARMMGFRGPAKALYNPDTNLKYGMKYLAGAYKRSGGTVCGTVLRYNAGHGAKRMNPISARYCRKAKRILGRRHRVHTPNI